MDSFTSDIPALTIIIISNNKVKRMTLVISSNWNFYIIADDLR